MLGERIKVGIADLKVAVTPNILTTFGLGSCIAVALYDPVKKIGGLSHFMLPDTSFSRNTSNPAKFATLAIDILIDKMVESGASKGRLTAKLVGGSSMFSSISNVNSSMNMGEKNYQAAKEILSKKGIKILAEEVGGNYGRSLDFFTENGTVLVKSVMMGEKEI